MNAPVFNDNNSQKKSLENLPEESTFLDTVLIVIKSNYNGHLERYHNRYKSVVFTKLLHHFDFIHKLSHSLCSGKTEQWICFITSVYEESYSSKGRIISLRLRGNFTLVSNICEAGPISLF